ncbi:protein transport protein Sec24B-like [Megalops cyprinoides]|uniref:protein transport protein Sec24B-like n=1 Tax=Megalops cyprinoides TaxID=118141 RepID=UPI001864E742|nr:protein transport protein Sec24B-like [Megalops cyprinoides]
MSAPGFSNLNSSAAYSANTTPNGGAPVPCQNGPGQMYPAVHNAAGYYGNPQQMYPFTSMDSTLAPAKAPVMTNQYDTNYYYNSHQQPLQPTARAGPGPAPYQATPQPLSTARPLYPAPIHAPPQQPPFQQPAPHPTAQYGYPAVSQGPANPTQRLSSAGAPLHPIVSYPSAPGSSQYGTLRSAQTAGPGPVPSVLGGPQSQLQQVPLGNGGLPGSVSLVQPSCTGAPPGPASLLNGQTITAPPPSAAQPSDQSQQPVATYQYRPAQPNAASQAGDRPPSGTSSTSLRSSPSHQQRMQYGYVANSGVSSTAAPPSSSSSDKDEEEEDDEDEDEDEEAGANSSSTTASASPVPENYEALEGGGYPDSSTYAHQPPASSAAPTPIGYGYPSLQPAYQQGPASRTDSSPSQGRYSSPPGYEQYPQSFPSMSQLSAALGGLGAPELEVEGLRPVNLLQERNILPPAPLQPSEPNLSADLKKVNCSGNTFRCTLTNIPQTQALLNKARLPLGLILHPFRDLTQLPVITSNTIVRCRSCRTYINPFVSFLDQRRWKCNMCYRVNEVPDEFMYNPLTRSYGEPHKRPEVQNATVEFIASSDYMLRPPQPAVYLFVLDVSHNAVESGYLSVLCQSLLENLDKLPGDTRTKVGFITFDSTVHFYNLQEGLSQPQMLVVSDIDDIFLPTPDGLLGNLKESKELVQDLLTALPGMFSHTRETHSALGPALQAALKLMSPTGGRVSVFQTQLPSLGAGLLQSREDPNQRSSTKGVQHLGPATDFYKKLALDCSGHQIAVDLFLLSSQYSDMASLACMSKYSAGCIFYYPGFHHVHNPAQLEKLQKDLRRYLTRKIGFEAVMRIRCTKGLSIHTFHGNFFVRSTDLLSLANINPDSGFAVQMSIEESLADTSLACFQAALLYTSSKGKRRIRVHTLCLPVVSQVTDVFAGADVQAITCLLANMAIDRSVASSLSDAREALVNAVVDLLSAYRSSVSNLQQSGVVAPAALRLFPLYVLALLKQKALRTGTSTRLDDRVFAMCEFKSQPLPQIMRMVHPDLYRVDDLSDEGALQLNDRTVPQPRLLQLTAEKLTREGAFLMDCGNVLYLWVGRACSEGFLRDVLGCQSHASIPPDMTQLPELENPSSERMRSFLSWLQESRSFGPTLYVVKDDTSAKTSFFQHLVEDRTESAFSYYEFLLHIQQQMSK